MVKRFFFVFVVLFSILYFYSCKSNDVLNNDEKKDEALVVGISYGNIATNFIEKDIDGNEFKLEDYKGKVVLLSFSAMWCGPCRNEAKELMELYNKYKERGFELIQCVYEDEQGNPADEADLKRWQNEFGIKFILISDLDNSTVNLYKIAAIPTNFVINREFVIKHRGEGFNKSVIEEVISNSL